MNKFKDNPWYLVVHFIVTTLFLSAPALFNEYPIIYADSGQYVRSTMTLIPPATSPMGYSFFIRAFSWQASLWPVVFAQAFIVNIYIYHILRMFFGKTRLSMRHMLVVGFLTLFSGVAWFTSQIMPDFFSSVLILSVFVFISGYENRAFRIFNILIMMMAAICHFTYVYILIMLFVTLGVAYLIMRRKMPDIRKRYINLIWLIPIIIFAYLFTPFYNSQKGFEFSTSRQKHVFMMARLVETGIVDDYLDEHCAETNYRLCEFKDELPNTPPAFVWDANSPFYKTGGWNDSKEEYEEILHGIFTSPKYLGRFIYEGFTSTLKQLSFFEMTYFHPYKPGTSQHENLLMVFPNEIKEFEESRQNGLRFPNIRYHNILNYILVVFAIVGIMLAWSRNKLKGKTGMFVFVVVMGVLYNASISATFSNVVNRYQARVVWVLIFIGLILIMKFVYPKIREGFNKLLAKNEN